MVNQVSVDNHLQAPVYMAYSDPQSCGEAACIRGESWAAPVDGTDSYQQADLCSAFATGYGLVSVPVIHSAPEPIFGHTGSSAVNTRKFA